MAEPTRIFAHLAGYNKKRPSLIDRTLDKFDRKGYLEKGLSKIGYRRGRAFLENWLQNKVYGEELIDTENKAALVVDEKTGKNAIQYNIGACSGMENSRGIVIGDKASLDSILEGNDYVHEIFEQQNNKLENEVMAFEKAKALQKELQEQGKNVSPYIFYIYGDTLCEEPESVRDFTQKVESSGADLVLGITPKLPNGEDDQRQFFNSRPWLKFKDKTFRMSNIGAVRVTQDNDTRNRGVSVERYFLFSLGYLARKLLHPKNWCLVGNLLTNTDKFARKYKEKFNIEIDGESTKIATRGLAKTYLKYLAGNLSKNLNSSIEDIKGILEASFRTDDYSTNVQFIETSPKLEIDMDSDRDLRNARKMAAMKHLDVSYDDCHQMYLKCKDIGVKLVKLEGSNVNKQQKWRRYLPGSKKDYLIPANRIKEEIEKASYEPEKGHMYHPNMPPDKNSYFAALFYDLERAYNARKATNSKVIELWLDYTKDIVKKTSWNSQKKEFQNGKFTSDSINEMLECGTFYKNIYKSARAGHFNKKEIRQLTRAIKKINSVEGKVQKIIKYNPVNADQMIAKYL